MSERKTVVVNGCFDIIHPGHVKLIEHAAKYGDLYILLNSDESIRNLKDHEPVMSEDDRATVLQAIKGVKTVLIFKSQQDLNNLYAWIAPDVMVIGEEYRDRIIVGEEFAKELVFFPKVEGYSSSNYRKVIR